LVPAPKVLSPRSYGYCDDDSSRPVGCRAGEVDEVDGGSCADEHRFAAVGHDALMGTTPKPGIGKFDVIHVDVGRGGVGSGMIA
jgi:hypothetical protein